MKSFLEEIKNYTQAQAIKRIFDLFGHFSKENLIKMTYLSERITLIPEDREIIHRVRWYFENDHPALQLAYKVYNNLSPRCRERFIQNFIINSLLYGKSKREKFYKENGFYPPLNIVISPTMECNLRCFGCYAGSYDKQPILEKEYIQRILNEAHDMGIHFITISGGEPFTLDYLLDIFEEYNNMYFQIYTNGTLITKTIADQLADLGNVGVLISVEGFKEETDERRGRGIFEKVMEVMELLKDRGIIWGFSATVTRYNYKQLTSDEFIDMMIDKGCLLGYYFQYVPVGRNINMELMPLPQQRNYIRERCWKIRDTKPIFVVDFWNDGPWVEGCIAAGRFYLHVNNRGDIEPCVFVHLATHNIHNSTLKEALASPFFKEIRSKQPFSKNHLTPCMIIDNPKILRKIYQEYKPYPTDETVLLLFDKFAKDLDDYAEQMHRLTADIWDKLCVSH